MATIIQCETVPGTPVTVTIETGTGSLPYVVTRHPHGEMFTTYYQRSCENWNDAREMANTLWRGAIAARDEDRFK